jgi:transcriptional regulator with XRE-family HTH domain
LIFNHTASIIKYHRKLQDLTQRELAKKFRYTPQFVCNWEKGKSAPPRASFAMVCKLLKLDKQVLIANILLDYGEWLGGAEWIKR